MRYGFYVSGKASVLKRMLRNPNVNAYLDEFALIVSDNPEDEELQQLCTKTGIDLEFYHGVYHDKSERDRMRSVFLLEKLESYSVHYCFVYGTGILVDPLLGKYANRLINFHPSLLPAYKGLHALDRALAGKTLLIGNTAHFITADIDGGPVIMQNIVSYQQFSTIDNVLNNQNIMQIQIINWISQDRIRIVGERVYVNDADYSIADYVPNIEDNVISDFSQ